MEASRGARAHGRHGGLDRQTFSWKLQAIMLAPTQTYGSLAAPPEGAAHTEPRAVPACRLHARVRQQPRDSIHYVDAPSVELGEVELQ